MKAYRQPAGSAAPTALHLAMHAVAVRKHGGLDELGVVAGLPREQLEAVLADAVEAGRVATANGKYLLTPAGQLVLAGEYSRFHAGLRDNGAFVEAYERFELVNRELKQLITDWQTVDMGGRRVPNDHADADYDARVLDRLGALHERFTPVLARLVAGEARLAGYRTRLEHALDRAEDGEAAYVSDARLDSYHTVWFELHEDLLRLLGREREE